MSTPFEDKHTFNCSASFLLTYLKTPNKVDNDKSLRATISFNKLDCCKCGCNDHARIRQHLIFHYMYLYQVLFFFHLGILCDRETTIMTIGISLFSETNKNRSPTDLHKRDNKYDFNSLLFEIELW